MDGTVVLTVVDVDDRNRLEPTEILAALQVSTAAVWREREERTGPSDFALFFWEKRMKEEKVKPRLHQSNTLIDINWVSSEQLPLPTSTTPTASSTTSATVQLHKRRILCVDDDVLGTTLRAEILREHRYSVVIYHSPLAVLDCDLSIFDLAILDFDMPGLNGRELLLRMRTLGARFPIVLLTGFQKALSDEDLVLFARCIDKGMPTDYLLDTIAEFLDSNQVPDYGS
jgi:CheY-like chemotaxis protein